MPWTDRIALGHESALPLPTFDDRPRAAVRWFRAVEYWHSRPRRTSRFDVSRRGGGPLVTFCAGDKHDCGRCCPLALVSSAKIGLRERSNCSTSAKDRGSGACCQRVAIAVGALVSDHDSSGVAGSDHGKERGGQSDVSGSDTYRVPALGNLDKDRPGRIHCRRPPQGGNLDGACHTGDGCFHAKLA